jgi:hypothetical protein
MKRTIALIWISCFIHLACYAQSQEATQLILNYEKLQQLEKILDNMYKGYKILSKGYNTIKNIAEGNFDLHQMFLDRLFNVNPAIRDYKRVKDIIQYQQLLVREYRRAYNRFRRDRNLTIAELNYIESVYANLLRQSLKNLDDLVTVITAAQLRMSDDERITSIDRIFADMEDKLSFLKEFNNTTRLLVMQRAKQRHDTEAVQKLYNLNE